MATTEKVPNETTKGAMREAEVKRAIILPEDEYLKRSVLFVAGRAHGRIYGGPFAHYKPTRRLVSVKMAKEIDMKCDISIPTVDYNVPDKAQLLEGCLGAIDELANGNDIYAGCMGGVGRTGLFMAVMLKAQIAYIGTKQDPILAVRQQYNEHAVETKEQEQYVRDFDVKPLVEELETLNGEKPAKAKKRETAKPVTFLGVTLGFARALAVFLPALIAFLAYLQKKLDKR
jgi:hypothetical protein